MQQVTVATCLCKQLQFAGAHNALSISKSIFGLTGSSFELEEITLSDSRRRPEVTRAKPCVSMATPVR